jgi:lipopolysaccharide transport system permease protein
MHMSTRTDEATTLLTGPETDESAGPPPERPAAPTPETGVAAEPTVTVIEPPRGWQLINVRELWQYRELVFFLAWRDVKVRYKQTLLGAAWAVLQPAMMMVVFTIFFSHLGGVASGDLPYTVFVYAGLLPWTFFATAITSAGNSVVGSERLITKIYFPRLAVPLAAVGAALVDSLIASGLLLVLMIWKGIVPGPTLLLAPVFMLFILLAAVGVGTLLAALNVAYRDFRYVIPFLTQFWMFATPTVYMQPKAEGGNFWLLAANPMSGLVAAFRASVLPTPDNPIDWAQAGIAAVLSVLLFVGGCLYFRRVEDSFADII